MVASETFADFLREQLAPLGYISLRRMFGKTGVFCDGGHRLGPARARRRVPQQAEVRPYRSDSALAAAARRGRVSLRERFRISVGGLNG